MPAAMPIARVPSMTPIIPVTPAMMPVIAVVPAMTPIIAVTPTMMIPIVMEVSGEVAVEIPVDIDVAIEVAIDVDVAVEIPVPIEVVVATTHLVPPATSAPSSHVAAAPSGMHSSVEAAVTAATESHMAGLCGAGYEHSDAKPGCE